MRALPALLLLVAACSAKTSDPVDSRYGDRMKKIATTYEQIPRVEEPCRVAMLACAAMVAKPQMHTVTRGSAAAKGEHARKIYDVRASDFSQLRADEAPAGLVVVKEAWLPVEAGATDALAGLGGCDSPPVVMDGKKYKAGERAGLFVMEKLDPKTEGTDRGWIYGTISADGTVTGAGNIGSCASCHANAPHDRLFSPEPS